jgi:hypothetical protein
MIAEPHYKKSRRKGTGFLWRQLLEKRYISLLILVERKKEIQMFLGRFMCPRATRGRARPYVRVAHILFNLNFSLQHGVFDARFFI